VYATAVTPEDPEQRLPKLVGIVASILPVSNMLERAIANLTEQIQVASHYCLSR
jgi:hypothetical protein